VLKGSLEGFGLAELFRLLSQTKKTGRLDVTRSAGRGQIYFREGTVYHATSSLSTMPLGRRLVDLGALTERRLAQALDQHAVTGERVGDILLQTRAVAEEQLEAAVRLQVEDAVFDLMRWDRGEFSWQPGVAIATEVPVAFLVEELIVEASRRIDELDVIRAKVPSPNAVMTLSAEAPRAHANVSMTPAEWQVLVLVDGHRTVAEIAELAEVENEVAMQMLHGLTSAGLIELAHAGPGTGVLGQAHPPAASPRPLPGRIGDGPRPFYDLLGGPGPEVEGDESQYFLKPAAEEPGAWPEAAPEAQEVDAAQAGMDTEIVETEAGPTGSPPASESPAATTSQSGPADAPPDVGPDLLGSEIVPSPDSETADPLAPILEETGGWPEGPSPGALDDWFADSDTTFEGFDLPAPGELITEEPGETSTAPEVDDAPVENEFVEDEPGGDSVPAETNGLLTSAPSQGAEALLASADDLGDFPEPARKRVEDDERVTKGLINRLIEGLKGL
jgi:Domain of unknown function (DUF4388)